MKFSHSVQFNSVPEWSHHYIAYSNLKKLIYTLEKAHRQAELGGSSTRDAESTPLVTQDPDEIYRRALDEELNKIVDFYAVKEKEIFREVDDLVDDSEDFVAEAEEADEDGLASSSHGLSGDKKKRNTPGFRNPFHGNRVRSASIDHIEEEVEDSDDDEDDEADETSALRRKSTSAGRPHRTLDSSMHSGRESIAAFKDIGSRKRKASVGTMDFSDSAIQALFSSSITLKKRSIGQYTSLSELRSYIQLNKTGFSKALKKYDKTLDRKLKNKYLDERVKNAYPFQDSTMERLDEQIRKVENCYAKVATQGDLATAKKELRLHLREHVVWERNTVWREMIGIERKAQAANLGIRRTLLGGPAGSGGHKQGDELDIEATKEITTPVGRYKCPRWLFSSTFFTLIVIIAIFAVLLTVPIMKKPEQQNCLALLVFVSLLWATEVIPLFTTSIMIPFLVVLLQVMRSEDKPHHRLDAKDATKAVFAAMWTPVIMLLLGGFTIAAALSKYHIAKLMATFVLSKAGNKPKVVLITNMFVAMVLSMWISNVAAPVLCFSIIQPLLRNLPADSSFIKALILGIALASNIGGAASPIASPQNIIALQNMDPNPSWGTWFFIALPVCVISIVLIWALLVVTFPSKGTNIIPIRPVKDPFTGVQWFISIVTLGTIVLWCFSHQLEHLFGDMGVIAIIPMVLFFGTGILTKEDFNNFLWTIIILAAGGLSLGKAVSSSGLLHTIANAITESVHDFSLYGVLVVFAGLILVFATFISHTVAALIILPLVRQVGVNMVDGRPNVLVMVAALMCSCAMGLPTSGFPNMTAIMMEDSHTGQRYLAVKHFISRGVPASIMAFLVVISVGYGLSLVAGL